MDGTGTNTDPHALRNQAFIAESVNRVKAWIAPLNITGNRTPMFFVFPMSLDGACYIRLSEALGEDQPFYAFQVPTKERTPEIAASVPGMAERLIAEFEKVHRKGDFILGGWSAGAIIALEMAQQLTQKGRPPAILAAIDHAPFNTGFRFRVLWEKPRSEKRKPFILSPFIAVAKKFASPIVVLSSHAHRNLNSWNALVGRHPIQKMLDDARSREMRELLKKLYKLLIEYRPSRYDGPVLLFLSTEFAKFDYGRKWQVFARNLRVRHFEGTPENPTTHQSFVGGDHVDAFAAALKEEVGLLLQGRDAIQRAALAPVNS